MEVIEVDFSPTQKLPDGYKVAWYECDEHYHWLFGDQESEAFSSRWQARRSAISHFKNNLK